MKPGARNHDAQPPSISKNDGPSNTDVSSNSPGLKQSTEIDGADVFRMLADKSTLGLMDSIHAPKNRYNKFSNPFKPVPAPAIRPSTVFAANRDKGSSDELRAGESGNGQDNYRKVYSATNHGKYSNEEDLQQASFFGTKEHARPDLRAAVFGRVEDEHEQTLSRYREQALTKVAARSSSGMPTTLLQLFVANFYTLAVMHERDTEFVPAFEGVATDLSAQDRAKRYSDATLASSPHEAHGRKTLAVALMKNPVHRSNIPKMRDSDAEDRKLIKHFVGSSTALTREQPAGRPRGVFFSNLPADADLTLVQSLAYGAALELFELVPGQTIAYVVFVNPDAAKALRDAHPNGITFKNPTNLRKHNVSVTLGRDIDGISGTLQAYLDCDATRVVKVVGVDEAWGMRTLYKLAGSMHRMVENIIDKWRNDTRTVYFRFTSIADAVSFKAGLVRDADWDGSRITFGVDPCELADCVHLEI